MPELPEVETVRLQLLHKVVGKEIADVSVFHPKTVNYDLTISEKLYGKEIASIDRVGKLLIFSFANEDNLFLLAHLKMTGQFFFVDKKRSVTGGGHSMTASDTALPHAHTRVAFHFKDKTVLYFNDMRLFGYTKLATATEVEYARAKFGPEPIADTFDIPDFVKKIRARNTTIKAALLNQSLIAGLGNIYVDEALWQVKVSPLRKTNRLTKAEATAIAIAAGEIMNESIRVGGTTFQHFTDTGGNNGNFTDYLKVFGKQDTPCPRCQHTIKKTRCAGRGTHYCPQCQK